MRTVTVTASSAASAAMDIIRYGMRLLSSKIRPMGYHSTIYGCIFGVAYGAAWDERDAIMAANHAVIRELPVDDDYPELTRNMFHVTGFLYGHPGLMKVQPIPFGLVLKNVFDDWDICLQKFEKLLAKLAFSYAELHLDAEEAERRYAHHYLWRS